MILIKNNVKRVLNDKETIKIFLDNGWEEVKEPAKSKNKEK